MKKLIFTIQISLAVLLVSAQTVTLPFAIGEWAPYTGQTIKEHGIVSSIVTAACLQAGIKPAYSFFPWLRAEEMVRSGVSFATFPYSISPERKDVFLFSEPIIEGIVSVVSLRQNAKTAGFIYQTPADLKPFSVGCTAGNPQVDVFKKEGIRVLTTDKPDNCVIFLKNGKFDVIVEDRLVILDAINRYFPDEAVNFVFQDKPYSSGIFYRIMVSKSYPSSAGLLDRFNKGLASIKANGTFTKILAKYETGN